MSDALTYLPELSLGDAALHSDAGVGSSDKDSARGEEKGNVKPRRRRHARHHNRGRKQSTNCNCHRHTCLWRQIVERWGNPYFLTLPEGTSLPSPPPRPVAAVKPYPHISLPLPPPRPLPPLMPPPSQVQGQNHNWRSPAPLVNPQQFHFLSELPPQWPSQAHLLLHHNQTPLDPSNFFLDFEPDWDSTSSFDYPE